MVLPWRNADLSRTHVSFNLKLSKDGLSKIAMSKIISSKFISSAANAYETHSERAWFFLVSRPLWGLLKTTQQGLWAVVAGGGRLSVGGNKTHTVGLQPVVASEKTPTVWAHPIFSGWWVLSIFLGPMTQIHCATHYSVPGNITGPWDAYLEPTS